MQRRAEVALLAAVVAGMALVLLATQPRDVYWGPDSGNRFIQLRSFLRTGGLAVDDAPQAAHHFVQVAGRVYSFYSPAFPLASAPFYALLGTWGLFLLPLAGTLAIVMLLSPLLERDYLPIATAAVFATPLFWYTLVFWEHTLAAALALGAYVLLVRERPFAAGLVAALGAVFREEGYVMIAAVAVALVLTRRRVVLPFLTGTLVPLLPLWSFNWMTFGHPLGLHAAVYTSLGGLRASNWWIYLFEFRAWPHVLRDTLSTQGFFPAVPLACALAFARDRFLLIVIAAGLLLTPLALNQADFGIIWGPRHFLWLVPLVAVAVAPALRRSRASAAALVLLIALGVALQIQGIRLLRAKLRFSEDLLHAAAAAHKPIVTDVFWVPEDLAALRVTLVRNDDELPATPLLFIATRTTRVISARPLAPRIVRRVRVGGGGDPMLEAMLLDCR
jgi:hypothetical protein